MFCLFSPSKCIDLLQTCGEERVEVKADEQTLVELDSEKVDPEKVDLAKVNLDIIDLDKDDLDKFNLKIVDLDKLGLDKDDLDKNGLDKVNLDIIDLDKDYLDKVDLDKVNLKRVDNFDKLGLDKDDLENVDLEKVRFENVDLDKVDLEKLVLQKVHDDEDSTSGSSRVLEETKMHSSECAAASGPGLLLQLGRLVVGARSASPARQIVPPSASSGEDDAAVQQQLDRRVQALYEHLEPLCIEVSLGAEKCECEFERGRCALLLERWTMRAIPYTKGKDSPALINSQWLLNAVRSQLHFSQLSAWLARLHSSQPRRKLSREQCNFKKLEANSADSERALHIVYSVRSEQGGEFARPPADHTFPFTDIGNNTYLKVNLESLPRLDDIPPIRCQRQSQAPSLKRRPSKDHTEELVGKLNDLTIGSRKYDGAINSNIGTPSRRLSIISNPGSTEYLYTAVHRPLLDDRMHTPCSESGKHKCNCDDESDGNKEKEKEKQTPKKLDERRLKEIAKYKRRIRKEKLKKINDSTSSEGDGVKCKETTSIPILQAARFDRFRAIGCYRNQTYLTLPAGRIETKSPFVEDEYTPPEFKKTNTVSTQTDDILCRCGVAVDFKCENCHRGMVRSDGNYNLASLNEDKQEIGGRRKFEETVEDEKSMKKHKCDNSIKCDNVNSNNVEGLIKRPKLRRVLPLVGRLDRIVSDRRGEMDREVHQKNGEDKSRIDTEKDIRDLHLLTDDSVFSVPKDCKRQKTFSISDDDYVMYEKCDYGTIDRHEAESPKEESPELKFVPPHQEYQNGEANGRHDVTTKEGFVFPDPKKNHDNIPSAREVDGFRARLGSAASMVFTGAGLPLTSSPAPLRRNNNCFDYDDSINGISGIKSALFPPSPRPASPVPPASPASPRAPRPRRDRAKLKYGPGSGLLGSFEESALQGRLEAVATVHGFTAELGASGAFCPPHVRLPVTVFFYAPGGTNAPYMGHINLGPQGYRVARSGTIQVSLFNPHGTLVKMFVVLYELGCMPPGARTFLRQRTLYLPPGAEPHPAPALCRKYLRYLIHLRFMTSKSGKLYLHTDIRLIVSRKADLDTATAHSLYRPLPTNSDKQNDKKDQKDQQTNRAPNRVFGGSSEHDSEKQMTELGYENQNGVAYELRSFTYAPENPRYSPR